MATSEMAREVGKDVAWGIPTFGGALSVAAGFTLQQWVYVVTIVYTLMLIGKQLPKMYGCIACFIRNRTCERSCKD